MIQQIGEEAKDIYQEKIAEEKKEIYLSSQEQVICQYVL